MTLTDFIQLPEPGALPVRVELFAGSDVADQVHLLEKKELLAINAALSAGRPLLVRGEPGTGKSQLARAAAKLMGRAFLKYVIDSRSGSQDLLWNFDAVRRLAEAQLLGALGGDLASRRVEARQALEVQRFVQPGPLWWAFDWDSARRQAELVGVNAPNQLDGGDWRKGCVVLLDEIDKAESELPNGLLEALGNREFTPVGHGESVRSGGIQPLVIITTNEERTLPDAFMRRCLVLNLGLPRRETQLKAFLKTRGAAHFPDAAPDVLVKAADLLHDHRQAAREALVTPLPGQAEYLDLLRAVLGLEKDKKKQLQLLNDVGEYTLKKNMALVDADETNDE